MEYSDALTYMREQEAAPITGDGVILESAELDRRVVAHMRAHGMGSDQYVEALDAVVAADEPAPHDRHAECTGDPRPFRPARRLNGTYVDELADSAPKGDQAAGD